MPLSVAGAFHTAVHGLGPRASSRAWSAACGPAEPSRLLLSNADGAAVDTGAEALSPAGQPGHQPGALRRLPGHHARARRHRRRSSCRPAGALAGLAKREWKGAGIEILALTGPGRPRPRARAHRRRARPRRGRAPARLAGRRLPGRAAPSAPPRSPRARRLPAGTPLGLHPQPARGGQRLRRLRRGTGRVARPRRRPRRRRGSDRPSLPGGLGMTTIQLPAGAGRRAHPRPRRLPTAAPGDQRRTRPGHGHQRRVDPEPGRHRRAPLGVARTRPSSRWPSRPAARRWRPAGCRRRRDRPGHRGQRQPARAHPGHRPAGRPPAGHPPARRLRPQRRLRRGSATPSASPPTRIRAGSAPQRPGRRRRAAHRRHRPRPTARPR